MFTEHLLHVSNCARSKTPLLPLSEAKRQWVILTECDRHHRCNHNVLGIPGDREKEGKASFTEVSPSQGFACYGSTEGQEDTAILGRGKNIAQDEKTEHR